MKMVYRTLIQSKMVYASFLCPFSTVSYHAFESLLQRLFQCCIGMRVKNSKIPRLLILFNLETLADRRRMMTNAFASRLCNIQDDDTATDRQKLQARNTQKALETPISFRRIVATVREPHGKDQLMRMQERKREQIRGIMCRPTPRMKGLPPALRMRSATDRALACRRHLGTFPIHYRSLRRIGLQNQLDDLKLLMKKKTSPIESRRIRIALKVISSIPELENSPANQD